MSLKDIPIENNLDDYLNSLITLSETDEPKFNPIKEFVYEGKVFNFIKSGVAKGEITIKSFGSTTYDLFASKIITLVKIKDYNLISINKDMDAQNYMKITTGGEENMERIELDISEKVQHKKKEELIYGFTSVKKKLVYIIPEKKMVGSGFKYSAKNVSGIEFVSSNLEAFNLMQVYNKFKKENPEIEGIERMNKRNNIIKKLNEIPYEKIPYQNRMIGKGDLQVVDAFYQFVSGNKEPFQSKYKGTREELNGLMDAIDNIELDDLPSDDDAIEEFNKFYSWIKKKSGQKGGTRRRKSGDIKRNSKKTRRKRRN